MSLMIDKIMKTFFSELLRLRAARIASSFDRNYDWFLFSFGLHIVCHIRPKILDWPVI